MLGARALGTNATSADATSTPDRRIQQLLRQLLVVTNADSPASTKPSMPSSQPPATTTTSPPSSSAASTQAAIDNLFSYYSALSGSSSAAASKGALTSPEARELWLRKQNALLALAAELVPHSHRVQALQHRLSKIESPTGLFALLNLRKDLLVSAPLPLPSPPLSLYGS
jgi:hypothetical protein